ncbi:MAG TPA: 3-hydroxyacyl-CoA dehydrogenase family protein [Bryobacteraceae bacterium]|nr:3-hydroxyacyl-CoA dehydrogenase family protein [Bryobacteraceae bacterium]
MKEQRVPAGVVGLGLMGTSIVTCLVAAGHPVVAIDKDAARRRKLKQRVSVLLRDMRREKLLSKEPASVLKHLSTSGDFAALRDCGLVIESIFENLSDKREVLRKIENAVAPGALIGSNTSALPVTELQRGARHPERILGVHWGEPAHILRFLEVICGAETDPQNAQKVMRLASLWKKEPTLVRRDVRGFITNRIMYAMMREAFYLVENGYATVEDVDRSVRNDMGYWITMAGPFRYMDLTGIPAYAAVMRDLLPDLCCATNTPKLMQEVVASGARGISNAKGFYPYTPAEAKRWEKRFLDFSYEIRALALKYAERPKN